MGDDTTLQEKMLKELMGMYQDKSQDWVYSLDEVEDNRWSDFDRDDEEENYSTSTEYAVILMDELTENNLDSHILLKYPKIADWWGSVLKERKKKAEALRKREEARRQKEEDKRAREVLVARLTPEERRLLGVK
jgi:hypothetical protein